ncbi:MAG: hypothetical protein K0Q90_401 [Paenibacillaceae bacterium]|jgi:two-component system response regulator YesN|nr:hypothetical protein [Paenibacillaceae bacterium]
MYKLIIVDDEEEIRDGLSDLIDWAGLGFTVVKKLQDGGEAIRYLEEHEADAVLTDIKMTFASGIDLARHIHTRKLPLKVVILSGFQEFALAREAIRYNVVHYLTKPTDLDEVAAVFRSIKTELDEEKREREEAQLQSQHIKMLKPLLMEQFFFNLLSGGAFSQSPGELKDRLAHMGLPADPAEGRCCLLSVAWTGAASREQDGRRSEERRAISVAIAKEQEQIHYTCVHLESGRFLIIGHALAPLPALEFQKRVERHFLHNQGALLSLLGVSIRLEQLQVYASLLEMLEEYRRPAAETEDEPQREEPAVADKERERIIIRQAKQYIAEHFEMELTLADVSRHVGLNPVYFSRLFKQETGKTYSDYCTDIRMNKAMDYLKDPKYKVYEVGFLVGYKNTKYFHKLFKRQTGLTPSEYRDRL